MVTTIEAIWGRIEKLDQLVTIQGEQIRRLEANTMKIVDFLGIKPAG